MQTPACQKVLVLISGGRRYIKKLGLANEFLASGPTFRIMPVVPRGVEVSKVLPETLAKLNIAFWSGSVTSVIPDIFALSALTTQDRRVFISYRRLDSQPLADQLFESLSQARFDVFLDRFSVEPGVDFQRRLTEQLAHKSMVLLLESANILDSKWTTYEVNFARQYRLGLLALRLPRGRNVPVVEPDERMELKPKQFTSARNCARLRAAALEKVVERIELVHGAAILRRRRYLRDAMSAALLKAGATSQQFGVDGLLIVRGPQGLRYVQLTPRPPELGDFHLSGRRADSTSKAIVIGPADTLAVATVSSLNWLSDVTNIPFYDEGRIKDVAQLITGGRL